jgi:type IV fimbrial biogenesis protein FimT
MAGWTLVELMVVLAVAVLLVTAAAPQYGDWIASARLANEAQQLAASMTLARAEAIKRGQRVNLCRSADRRRCAGGGGWDAGWLVYVDINRNGQIDDDEPLLRIERAAPSGIRVAANRPVEDYVSYTSLGTARMLNGALQMGTFTLCRPGLRALHVVLANSGRVRVETSRDVCV